MAVKPVKRENLTLLQETYQRFWTKFNQISSQDDDFASNFKVHTIASIRYYQDYAIGKPYHICIKINFDRELASVQIYFNNLVVYDEFYTRHRERIETLIGKHLEWKEMTTKAYAQLNLNFPYLISDVSNWDNVCEDIIPNAIKMKETFNKF
jgi:hypothetical protein